MTTLVIGHPVADFDAWKRAFDNDPLCRQHNGVTRHAIYRPADDPDYVVMNLEFASPQPAREFLAALQQLWRRVGAEIGFGGADAVHTQILDEVERLDYPPAGAGPAPAAAIKAETATASRS